MGLAMNIISQPITLEYIFQEPQIINPRPSLKQISTFSNKIYYYADEDYNGSLSMFDYNYVTGETYKYPDTGFSASEFVIMQNGDCLAVIGGDIFISKNFTSNRTFSKDIQLTGTDGYEYSPVIRGNILIFRRSGNYYLTKMSETAELYNVITLTNDESDSISYQLIAIEETPWSANTVIRLLFAKYNNSNEEDYLFPDYTGEFVTARKNKRGVPETTLIELGVSIINNDSLYVSSVIEIKYPIDEKYLTIYSDYSADASAIVLDVETLDRHNRKLYWYDTFQKTINEIYSETDTAWFERHDNPTRFISSTEIIFSSEILGFNSIYKINIGAPGITKIAGGNYTIDESVYDYKNGKIYFTANKEHPYEYFIYETDFDGIALKQLTSEQGADEGLSLSPDGKYLFYEHSFINKPAELYYLRIEDYGSFEITNTISDKFSEIEWKIPEVIYYPNEEDGTTVYALVYKPNDFNPKNKYPLICFAHGEGYLQNVTYSLSHYSDNFMVYSYFTQQGFIVLDVDFRGSKGYGMEFRNKTYRNLGKWEISDYISGINFLSNKGYIDKNRVGLYGGSYGGFISLMAAFNHPEVFKAVAALRPVSNWKNYYYSNKRYTVPRLGDYKTDENKIYYEISSPITYADKLQIPLLLIHGMQDDNVFFQDAVQLTQKLIANGKDFDIMFYPEESHSFRLQSSWLDSYKRIFKFFEKNLKP